MEIPPLGLALMSFNHQRAGLKSSHMVRQIRKSRLAEQPWLGFCLAAKELKPSKPLCVYVFSRDQ